MVSSAEEDVDTDWRKVVFTEQTGDGLRQAVVGDPPCHTSSSSAGGHLVMLHGLCSVLLFLCAHVPMLLNKNNS